MNKQYVENNYCYERMGGSLNFKVKEFETIHQLRHSRFILPLEKGNGEVAISLLRGRNQCIW